MCRFWKFLGVTALSFSLIYNFMLLFVVVTFVLRCYDDCYDGVPVDFPEDCFGTNAMYKFYVPTLISAPLFIMADFQNIYYLEWWLLIHFILTCGSYLNFICYESYFLSDIVTSVNALSIAGLTIIFVLVAFHLIKLRRLSASNMVENTPESSA